MTKIASETAKEAVALRKLWLLFLLCGLLTGCHWQKSPDVTAHIVTEITVTCPDSELFTHRYYNTHAKMQQILLYLRAVSPGFTPKDDPESLAGSVIQITLHRADGSIKVYRQKNDRYLQEDQNGWKQIKAEWGADLMRLLLENESDFETAKDTVSSPA